MGWGKRGLGGRRQRALLGTGTTSRDGPRKRGGPKGKRVLRGQKKWAQDKARGGPEVLGPGAWRGGGKGGRGPLLNAQKGFFPLKPGF